MTSESKIGFWPGRMRTGTLPSGFSAKTVSFRFVGLVSWWMTSIRAASPASWAKTSALRAKGEWVW
jgi:hypothetical protein